MQPGEVIQLERKGYFRCDEAYGGYGARPAVLFLISDGKSTTKGGGRKGK